MRRAYSFCSLASTLLALPVLLLSCRDHYYTPERSLLYALLFLPSLLLSVAAAILNHFLPSPQQEKLEVNWRLRPSHPYWWLLMATLIEILYLLPALLPESSINEIIIPLALFYFLCYTGVLLVAYRRKRHPKSKKTHRKHR